MSMSKGVYNKLAEELDATQQMKKSLMQQPP